MANYFRDNWDHLKSWYPTVGADFFTQAGQRANLQRQREELQAGLSVRFYLFAREAPRTLLGTVALNNIQRGPMQGAHVGYGLAKEAEGKGLMAEAMEAVIDYAFASLRLHRLMANYVPYNLRSGSLLRRLGFVVDGYARDYLWVGGGWRDHVLTSLTNPDWPVPEAWTRG